MFDADFLTELYWFTTVAELGSYSAAALQAGVAKSSISRRIKQLESRLGAQLLDRHTRKLTLTSVGEEIYHHAVSMLDSAQAAQVAAWAISEKPTGRIRVAVPAILSAWLLDIVSRFHETYPDVRYEVHLDDQPNTLSTRHFDLCLSVQPVPADSADIVARPISGLEQGLFASPSFIQNMDHSGRVKDLTDDKILAWSNGRSIHPWKFQTTKKVIKSPAFASPDLRLLKEAAVAGLGIACLPTLACVRELENETLMPVFSEAEPASLDLIALTPSFRGITLATRILIDFIRNEVGTIADESR